MVADITTVRLGISAQAPWDVLAYPNRGAIHERPACGAWNEA